MTKVPLRDESGKLLSSTPAITTVRGRRAISALRAGSRDGDRRQHFSVRGSGDLPSHLRTTISTRTSGGRPVAIVSTLDQIRTSAADSRCVVGASDRKLMW